MAHDVCKVRMETLTLQRGPSGRRTLFVDIKFKVPSQYKLLIQSRPHIRSTDNSSARLFVQFLASPVL